MAGNGYRLGRVMAGQAEVSVDGQRIGKVRVSGTGHGWDALDVIDRLLSQHEHRSEAGAAVYERWKAISDAVE